MIKTLGFCKILGYITACCVALVATWILLILPPADRNSGILLTITFVTLVLLNRKRLACVDVSVLIVLAIALRLLWAFVVQTEPFSDFATYWRLACELGDSGESPFASKAPATVVYYHLVARCHQSLWAVYSANALLGGLQTWLLYRIAFVLTRKQVTAAVAGLLWAVYPTSVVYSSTVNADTVTITFTLLAMYIGAHKLSREETPVRSALSPWNLLLLVTLSVATAAAYLSRNAALLFLIAMCLSIGVCSRRPFRRRATDVGIVLAVFFVCLIPQVAWNLQHRGALSIASNRWSSFVLLFGTSVETNGGYNEQEIKRIEDEGYSLATPKEFQQASARARNIALSRIFGAPIKFLKFALTRKFDRIWSNDHLLTWSAKKSRLFAGDSYRDLWGFIIETTNAYYAMLWCLTVLAILTGMRDRPAFFLLPMLYFLLTVGFHVFYEVQPRYHFSLMPYVCLIGASWAGRLPSRFSGKCASPSA